MNYDEKISRAISFKIQPLYVIDNVFAVVDGASPTSDILKYRIQNLDWKPNPIQADILLCELILDINTSHKIKERALLYLDYDNRYDLIKNVQNTDNDLIFYLKQLFNNNLITNNYHFSRIFVYHNTDREIYMYLFYHLFPRKKWSKIDVEYLQESANRGFMPALELYLRMVTYPVNTYESNCYTDYQNMYLAESSDLDLLINKVRDVLW